MLSFKLLGTVAIHKNGEALSQFRSQKEAALLIYLAHTGQTHQREGIAELLWGDRSTKRALSNLRTALTRLRKQVGSALLSTRKTLALAPDGQWQVDSTQLLQTLATVETVDCEAQAETLREALDSCTGDFLADFYLQDAPQFDKWVHTTREQIRRQVAAGYQKLGAYLLSTGDADSAIAHAHRWLEWDQLDEEAHALLIRLLLESGQEAKAISHYQHAVELLETELGVGPPEAMQALIEQALKKEALAQSTPLLVKDAARQPRHNLPTPYDQFVGRVYVRREIHARLDQSWCRLVTILGQGGVGKTRLATTVARERLDRYADGVWLVELADVDPNDDELAEAIAVEIASVLDLRLSGTQTPTEQLLAHLQHWEALLVLDNFEHFLSGTGIVSDLIQRCERVQILATSREALRLRAEWVVELAGLRFPSHDEDDVAREAMDLFVARRAQQRQAPILPAELTAIRAICRRVEGLPLALELAAALTIERSTQAIAAELAQNFDGLVTHFRDAPARHAGLAVVFEMSWRTLSPDLQARLARLALFRGGFTADAAGQIADARPHHLTALREKSLLQQADRYALHPVVRAYAAAKQTDTDALLRRHGDYYLALLAQHAEPLQRDAPQDSMAVLLPEMENVRLAWQTGLALHWAARLLPALPALSVVYQLRGLAREAEPVMQATSEAARGWGVAGMALATRAGLERVRFQNRLARYRPAMETVQRALKWAEACGDRWAVGMGQVMWGESLWRLGEYDAAQQKLTDALAIAQETDATDLSGWSHHHLGVIDDIQGHYPAALYHLQRACAAWRAIDNAQALSGSLNSIGLVCYHQGDLPAAQEAMEQALALCNRLDNRQLQSLLLNNLSMIATEQDDYFSAQHYLQFGLELANLNGDPSGQGLFYTNLGRNYRLLGEDNLAVENLEEGLRVSESIGNRSLMTVALFHLAEVERTRGNLEQAESLYRQALEVARQGKLQHIACRVLASMAKLLSKKDTKQAKEYSTEAVVLAEALQNPELLKRAQAIDGYVRASADVAEEAQPVKDTAG